MSDFEADVIDRLGRIETKLDNDYKALHGNGHPGLIDRVTNLENYLTIVKDNAKKLDNLEQDVKDVNKTLAANNGKRVGVSEFLASALSILSIVGAAISMVIAFKK